MKLLTTRIKYLAPRVLEETNNISYKQKLKQVLSGHL